MLIRKEKNMKAEMINIVETFLNDYIGGEEFYDALDEQIRINDVWLYTMISLVEEESFDKLIVSGNFGRKFYKFVTLKIGKELASKILVANGSLRKGNSIGLENRDFNGQKFIFIDDSFWAGRTRNAIQNYIEKNNGILTKTYVFYDGNKVKDENVVSFYRYYDYH